MKILYYALRGLIGLLSLALVLYIAYMVLVSTVNS
jgi:hypothetical protein